VRLDRNRSFLLVIDIQSRLAPAVHGNDNVTARCIALVRVARLLGVPAFATEHCPERIGPIVPELRTLLTGDEILSKRHFSCTDGPVILERLKGSGRSHAVVAGVEAHVCAMQAALGLAEHGFTPLFAIDDAGSRHVADHAAASTKCAPREYGSWLPRWQCSSGWATRTKRSSAKFSPS
jgi:nicotinamidase-related amidase